MKDLKQFTWQKWDYQRPFDFKDIKGLAVQLSGLSRRGAIAFEVWLTKDKISYFLGTREKDKAVVSQLLQTQRPITFSNKVKRPKLDTAKEVRIKHSYCQLNIDNAEEMVRSTLATSNHLVKDEAICLQLILGRATPPKPIPKDLGNPFAKWYQVISGNLPPLNTSSKSQLTNKLKEAQFEAVVRLGIKSRSLLRQTELTNTLLAGFRQLNSLAKVEVKSMSPHLLERLVLPKIPPYRLNASEVACFLCLPVGDMAIQGLSEIHPKRLDPPLGMVNTPSYARVFGRSLEEPARPLSLSPHKALYHTVLTGPTGVGKSTAMLQLILADIKAGRSTVVIDPKSDLVSYILERYPKGQEENLVVLDPTASLVVGINPFDLVKHGVPPEIVADSLLHLFQELYPDNFGIRSLDVLSHAFLTLARLPDASLVMLPSLLTNSTFRHKVLKQVSDPIGLDSFWAWYEGISSAERQQYISPVLNKLRQILLRPQLRAVLGQRNAKFNLMDIFTSRKTLLVPLNKSIIGAEAAKLLGSILVSCLWLLVLKRADVPPEKRHPVLVYIDELQDYLRLNTNLDDALTQARGLGVGFVLSHQYRNQLSPKLKSAIDANCHNKIVFGLSLGEARELARETLDLEAEDFHLLPAYHIYAKLPLTSAGWRWVSGKTNPAPASTRNKANLYAQSLDRYGQDSRAIDQAIQDLALEVATKDDKPAQPIGRKAKT